MDFKSDVDFVFFFTRPIAMYADGSRSVWLVYTMVIITEAVRLIIILRVSCAHADTPFRNLNVIFWGPKRTYSLETRHYCGIINQERRNIFGTTLARRSLGVYERSQTIDTL